MTCVRKRIWKNMSRNLPNIRVNPNHGRNARLVPYPMQNVTGLNKVNRYIEQGVLNDLRRTRLSRRCMNLLPPPFQSVSSTGDIQEDWDRETACLREKGEGVGEEQTHTTREGMVLYTLFSTLWYRVPFSLVQSSNQHDTLQYIDLMKEISTSSNWASYRKGWGCCSQHAPKP